MPELVELKAAEYGVDAALAKKIAFCESSFRQTDDSGRISRGLHNPDDIGLFQINEQFHLARSHKLGLDIYTASGNTEYAMWLLKNEGSKHWKWSKKCWAS